MLSSAIPVPGGVSIKGGRPGQAGVQLGTTTLVDPASGVAQVPLPDGAIESVTVLPNPYAVEYGRFSSGLIVIQSRRARDQWKFRAHRFGPSLRSRSDGGLRIDSFNPRMEVGGPLVKDRVYVEQSAQVRYNIGDLAGRPETEQRVTKALSSFTRVDANVSPKHFVVGTIGMFPNAADFANLSTFTGPEASVNLRILGKQLSLTERALWTNRTAAETTFQWFQSRTDVDPQGTAPMELQPDITLGNFFNRQHRTTSSYQVVHVVTGHRDGFGGSHLFKAGVDLLHTRYDGTSQSQTVLIERADGTVARRLDFSGASVQTIGGTEAARVCAGPSSAAPALVRRDGPPARSRRGARTREPLAADRHRGATHRVRQRRDARRLGTVRRADAVDGGCVHQLRERGRHAVPHRRRVGSLARIAL